MRKLNVRDKLYIKGQKEYFLEVFAIWHATDYLHNSQQPEKTKEGWQRFKNWYANGKLVYGVKFRVPQAYCTYDEYWTHFQTQYPGVSEDVCKAEYIKIPLLHYVYVPQDELKTYKVK